MIDVYEARRNVNKAYGDEAQKEFDNFMTNLNSIENASMNCRRALDIPIDYVDGFFTKRASNVRIQEQIEKLRLAGYRVRVWRPSYGDGGMVTVRW